MKLRIATVLGVVLAIYMVGTVSAHNAAPSCEAITITNTPVNEPAYIYNGSHATQSTLVSGPDQNGTYQVPGGSYEVIWPQWDSTKNWTDLTVGDCPTPSPTATASLTVSPMPSLTPSPERSPSPTPRGTPAVTPSPRHSTPHPTPPTTTTEAPILSIDLTGAYATLAVIAAAFLMVFLVTFFYIIPRRK